MAAARDHAGGPLEGDERTTFSRGRGEAKARYVKLAITKADDVERMLLGEIEIIEPAGAQPSPSGRSAPPPRPMHVKKTLDEALLEAGVDFLYSCYATDVLTDDGGQPCGIVMANRAGRQAVRGQDDHRRHRPGDRGPTGRSRSSGPIPPGRTRSSGW